MYRVWLCCDIRNEKEGGRVGVIAAPCKWERENIKSKLGFS